MNGRLRLAVTGNPVLHSISPQIFNSIFSKTGTKGFYTRVLADSIDEAVKSADIISLDGMNVTSPFKEDAVKTAGCRSSLSEYLNASNTLSFCKGNISANNTDPSGVSSPVFKRISCADGLKAVVIGAGGAAVAAVYALSEAGFKTVMVNRTIEKAKQRTAGFKNCTSESLDNINDAVRGASLVIHTLPVSDYFFNPEFLMKDAVLFDANYKYSPLKETALRMGLEYIDGREWLLAQAEAAFNIFKDCKDAEACCSREDCSDISLFKESADIFSASINFDNISLIGFMGSGKTAAGRKLSDLSGFEFIDTDSVIEKKAGMKISDIFAEKGESYFRKIESDVLTSVLINEKRKIISCGGGVVGDRGIREKLKNKSLPVWLLSSPETSLSRIKDNSRPLLESSGRYEKAVSLFNERIDFYGSVSQLIINTEYRDAENTAGRLYEEISEFI